MLEAPNIAFVSYELTFDRNLSYLVSWPISWLIGRLVRLVGVAINRLIGGAPVSSSHCSNGKEGNEGLKKRILSY